MLYTVDAEGGLITLQGYFQKLCELIMDNLDRPDVVDLRTPLPPPDLIRVKALGLRDYQVSDVAQLLSGLQVNSGIVRASVGWGKSVAQMTVYGAYHNLNTILAIPLKQVLVEAHKKFQTYFPEKHIGLVGNGSHDISKDITLCSYRSMESCALEKCQLLLMDEIQEATGPKIQEVIGKVSPLRIVGLTFTDRKLFSGTDKVLTGMFGSRLIDIDYQEAVAVGAVVPGVVWMVKMSSYTMVNLSHLKSIKSKLVRGIQKFEPRNQLIGEMCKAIPNKWQTIVFVEQVKNHLLWLHPHLPEGTKWVHRDSDKDQVGSFALTAKQQDTTIASFMKNEFQVLVGSSCIEAGVDAPNVRVVVPAQGGSSAVGIPQKVGRASRILTEEKRSELGVGPKSHCIVLDVYDDHCQTLENMSNNRKKIYESMGFKVFVINHHSEIKWEVF